MQDATLERVVFIVRELALEVGGDRAARSTTPLASLERDLGLGSLERVELLTRLEASFGRPLLDGALQLDTPTELARAVTAAGGHSPVAERRRDPGLAAAALVEREAATIHEALYLRACAEPERPSVYMREDDGVTTTLTYGRVWRDASAVAGALRDLGVARGDTVALMLPTGADFLVAFQGILVAGAVPVPIYPPVRLDRLQEYAERQSGILKDAAVRALITIPKAKPVAALFKAAVRSLQTVTTVAELKGRGASFGAPEGGPGDPAFIQYTSGSTGSPKGVLLTHANLLANIEAIGRGVEVRPTDVGASWLPLYHDMGLIGTWLFCQTKGLPLAIQSPLSFLSQARAVAVDDPRAAGHPGRRPQLRLRAVRPKHQGRGHRRSRPVLLAMRPERRRAREPRHPRALRHALRPLRLPARGDASRLRPGRELRGRVLPSRGSGSEARPPRPRTLRARGPRGGRPRRRRVDPPLRLRRPGPARARSEDRGRRGGRGGRARGRPTGLPRALDDLRLLQEAGSHRRHDPGGRMARQRRPRVPWPRARSTSPAGART